MESPSTDDTPTLDYRSGADERVADLWRQNRRRSWNAVHLVIAVVGVTLGVVVGLGAFCGAVVGFVEERTLANWPIVAVAGAFAAATLWLGSWAAGRVDPD
jgi:hypothetical protein